MYGEISMQFKFYATLLPKTNLFIVEVGKSLHATCCISVEMFHATKLLQAPHDTSVEFFCYGLYLMYIHCIILKARHNRLGRVPKMVCNRL